MDFTRRSESETTLTAHAATADTGYDNPAVDTEDGRSESCDLNENNVARSDFVVRLNGEVKCSNCSAISERMCERVCAQCSDTRRQICRCASCANKNNGEIIKSFSK